MQINRVRVRRVRVRERPRIDVSGRAIGALRLQMFDRIVVGQTIEVAGEDCARAAWQRLEANYETLRRNGKLPATYEVVYGHAWKPEIRPSRKLDDGSQIIEFMRPTRTA